ncbi:MAG: dienelactone hydrolase family protein [Gammaproteobacteria bacterium]
MTGETFTSLGKTYEITTYHGASSGKKYPVILLVHGNFGLGRPYGDQIHGFAKDLASHGYLTAVPQYYPDDDPQPFDTVPHDRTLADAIGALSRHTEADLDRIGLIGFSLGAATAMTFIASKPAGSVKVLADYFGFLTPTIEAGVNRFPPTIIFHNRYDAIVPVLNSEKLNLLLPGTIDHEFVSYHENWQEKFNHPFKPGGAADIDSRAKTTAWFIKHLPPTAK